MEERILYFNSTYVRLNSGVLTALTAGEAEIYCQTHRNTLVLFFKTGTEAAPAFFNHYPARVKVISLAGNMDELMISKDRELSGCFDLVITWIATLNPDGGFLKVIEAIRMR